MSDEAQTPDLSGGRGFQTVRERLYHALFFVCALLSVLTTIAIVLALLTEAVSFFAEVPLLDFLTGTRWSPTIRPVEFGVLPLVFGTVMVTIGAAALALPVGLLTAIYLSEYASPRVRSILKPALEVLAGIPTVVYGFLGLVYLTPALSVIFPSISTFNILSGSIIVGIMIIPMVSSISEDAMSSVPDSLRNAGYGLGATKFEVSTSVVVPSAVSGIVSSFILAISRAIGETMAVVIIVGAKANLPETSSIGGLPFVSPTELFDQFLEPGMTMTVAIVNLAVGDVATQSLAYRSLFAIGLTLFAITLIMNLISDLVAQRYREEY
ncbi:phosphate ABC transporter membrane protein 1, PhoT family [Halomicrobium zhouii]|uniref:Phosphate transport system permease protein n=1 Tax=Halomicrobium zhouii TaxID=767519 RepID=A0A1I6KR99_9EURY|nr:phosphate ABC transporter permease subunit PstC [Halomicrobium zhouii]SFR93704.1 phosphate ABC transporter membrane protein 1, PhoT family [Halomicrobium zhouii]